MSNHQKSNPKRKAAEQKAPVPEQLRHAEKPKSEEQNADPTKNQRNATPYQAQENRLRGPEWWMVGLTGLIFVTSFLQWQAIRDTIKTTDEQFRKGNRAYVTAMAPHLYNAVPKEGSTFTFAEETKFPIISIPYSLWRIDLKNTGNTPAQEVRAILVACLCELRMPDDTANEATKARNAASKNIGTTIAKDGMYYPQVRTPSISDSQLTEIISGKLILGAYGFVTYSDMFGEPHRTEFCFQYNPINNSLIGCEKGNKLD